MAQPRYQPQGGARLDQRSKFAANAQVVLSGAHNTNLVSSKPLVVAGTGYLKSGVPAGLAWSFRKNFYVETESLPAIGTGSFVEFWLGYPSNDLYARGSQSAPGMLTGHSANMIGIAGSVGTNSANVGTTNSAYWGAVYNWPTLTNAGEALTPGKLTLLAVVRRQSGTEFWRDGQLVRFVAQSPVNVPAGTFIAGSFVENTAYWTSSSDTVLAGRVITPVEPTAEEIQQFLANPWAALFPSWDDGLSAQTAANIYTLTGAVGAFSLDAAAVRMAAARRLVAAPGAVSVTGASAGLLARRRLPAAAGAFVAAAAFAGLLATRRLSTSAGAYSTAGLNAALRAARRLTAGAGAFTVSASSVQMTYVPAPGPGGPTYTLAGTSSGFGLAGAAAMLLARRRMAAASGSLALTGLATRIVARRRLAAAVGGYALQGVTVQVRARRLIAASAGGFDLSGAVAVLKYTSSGAAVDVTKIHPSRIVVFEGSGSRVVIFEGSGKRLRFENMSAKKPEKDGDKWVTERDPDEESYYAADITDELSDRFTTVMVGDDSIEIIVHGVAQLEAHSVEVVTIEGVERTFVVVFLGGIEGDPPDDWHWTARVRCANRERFDKTTWFKRVDT